MANLGTLWFGADIDLTQLKQKIGQGNKDILDALKLNYDPQSYQQMVSKLKSDLSKEDFRIKITTDTTSVRQSVQSTLNSIAGGAAAPKVDLSGMKGVAGMRRDLISLTESVVLQTEKVRNLKQEWSRLSQLHGKESIQAKNAYSAYRNASDVLALLKTNQGLLGVDIRRNTLAQSELNKQTKEAAKAARQWNSDHLRLNTTLAGGIHVSTQLGSALSSLFAIDAARQFLGNVIEIGGQLEKQRISIGAILGDTVKANHLFEQIKGLALKSPFGVVELDQYTKQLSAYGFKYSELFDTTKRLADISAGAGTDIGRLTLALGHVRSATYLTGITLRQFSMNNIPMLKMLADYYTEVEKKAVSTAEVQKRISKRHVSYEDVIEQIRRLTNEGGMFYNMQEKISESVAAKFKNLRDAMDIMYGEVAESFVGDMLKDLASVLLKTTRHWKEIALVMGAAGVSFAISKARIGLTTAALQGNTSATLRQIMTDKQLIANKLRAAQAYRTLTSQENIQIASSNRLTVADLRQAMATENLTKEDVLRLVALKRLKIAQAMHLVGVNGITAAEIRAAAAAGKWKTALAGLQMSLKNAFMGMGRGTLATMAIMAGTELYMAYNTWKSRIDDKAKEMTDVIKSRINDLRKIQKSIQTEGMPKESTELKNRIGDMKQVLANSEAYTKTLDEQLNKTSDLPTQYNLLAKAIENAAEKNRQMLQYQDDIADLIKASSVYAGKSFGAKLGQGMRYFFNDDITQNMAQTLDAYKDLRYVIDGAWEFKDAIKGVVEEMLASNEVSEDFKNQLRNSPFEEQVRLLAESEYWDVLKSKVIAQNPLFANFADKIQKASNGVTDRWKEIVDDDIPRMIKRQAALRIMTEKDFNKWCLENIDDFKMMLDGINDQLDIKEPSIRKRLKRLFYDYVRFGNLAGNIAAEGAVIGGNIFDESLQKLLDDEELAEIREETKKDNNKDAQLEAAKTRLQEYKAFLSEYKKYIEIYDKQKAINVLEKLFPNLKDDNGKFIGGQLIDNYSVMLDKLRDSLAMTSEARKKFANEINKTKADTLFDREKEAVKQNADAMTEYVKRMEEQWKLYRSLLKKSGGNKEFAAMAFNENGSVWDDVSKKMLERFNQRGQELGVMPVMFHWNMNEKEMKQALVNADGVVQDELVKLAQEIQKVIRGNYTRFLEDSASAYEKSLTAAQKLVELERQRQELINQRDNDNDQSPAKQKGWNTQIAAIDREIASQRWEAFKETEDFGRIFANLDNISTSTLENMRRKLLAELPAINENVEAVKALYEALDKINEKLQQRNPFSTIFNSAQQASRLRQLSSDWFKNGRTSFTPNAQSAKYYGLQADKKYTREEINDLIKNASEDFAGGIEGLAAEFKAVQDVLQPVIDLFDALGDTSLSNFFSMGSNALGAASQVAGGLNALGLESAAPYAAAAAAGLSVVSSLFAMQDAAIQEEIEASKQRQKEMENLTKSLERVLDRSLSGIYGLTGTSKQVSKLTNQTNSMKSYDAFRQMLAKTTGTNYEGYGSDIEAIEAAIKSGKDYELMRASLVAQQYELERQLRSEESKKKSDSGVIEDLKQQIEEMKDEIENFALDMAKTLYSIDVKSWAESFGDALFEAWQKGEDGAKAFKKKATEILAEVTKSIVVQSIIGEALKPVQKYIAKAMDETSGELEPVSFAQGLINVLEPIVTPLVNTVDTVLDTVDAALKGKGYDSMKDLDTSSSTSAGIKSITENTADLLSSYINAIRADVSVQRVDISAIRISVEALAQRNMLTVTQERHLENIASYTKRNAEASEAILKVLNDASLDQSRGFYMR